MFIIPLLRRGHARKRDAVLILKPPQPISGLLTGALATLLIACTAPTPSDEPARAPLAPPELRSPRAESAQAVPIGEPSASASTPSAPIVWRPDRPLRYTVRKGDTLWDIAGRFLRDPWRWPEVWHANPQVRNPHRIYPGDVLELAMVNGQLMLQPAEPPIPVTRLSPRIRREPLDEAIPALPYERIEPFLTQTMPIDREGLKNAPYVLRPMHAEQLIMGAGDRVYVRGTDAPAGSAFQVVEDKGVALIDPDNRKRLGHQVDVLGTVRILQAGDPAEALVIQSRREVRVGNRLLPVPASPMTPDLLPGVPTNPVSGRILLLSNAIARAGQYQSVTLGLGSAEGLQVGHVLSIYRGERSMRDPVRGGQVTLPPAVIGEVLVFRVSEHFSQALIVRSTRGIQVGDRVANPS